MRLLKDFVRIIFGFSPKEPDGISVVFLLVTVVDLIIIFLVRL